jgi:putative ABC transport system permease protein
VAVFFKILWQSLILSFEELRAAKLRSFLSLIGITIGILCIISVRTAVSSLELNIQKSFSSFGSDILYVQKWPWIFSQDYPWWKYFNRPITTPRELEQLKERLKGADAACLIYFSGGKTAIYEDRVAEGTPLMGVTLDYNKIKEMEFTQGRYFTAIEANNGQPVCIIGAEIAESLFEGRTQIEGEVIKVNGIKLTVVGVLKQEGDDMLGLSLDNNILIPYGMVSSFQNMNSLEGDPSIAVIPKKGVPVEELKYEIKGAMRSLRRLAPTQEENFAINQISMITEVIASVFTIVNVAGLIIGVFSIIVGAFGIANIMFVSVKERTYIIGIKKALGAKKLYILLEFLLEAVMLCIAGGLLGLVLVVGLFAGLQYLVTNVAESEFKFYITTGNVMLGLTISIVVGIIAGIIPAFIAANMRPVDAIRTN